VRGKGAGVGGGYLTSRQVVVVGPAPAGHRMTTMAELISSSGAQSLWQHQKFPAAGVPPPHLVIKTASAFVPKGPLMDVFPRIVHRVQTSGSKLSFLWAVQVKGHRIIPYGLALVVVKQILAKPEGTTL
jgi:hypothetical protein